MAGRPMLRDLAKRIEDKGGEEYVFGLLADAVTTGKVAEMFDCSRALLYNWRDMVPGRAERWAEAMKIAGMAYAEDAGDLLDRVMAEGDVNGGRARLAAETAKQKQWMASKLDRETFGEDKTAASVVVNLPGLHVGALRRVEGPNDDGGRVIEGEVIEDEATDAVGVLRGA